MMRQDESGASNEWTLSAPGIHGESVPMRDLSKEEVDFCIVGAGAAGGVLGAKLAEAGFSVVILDAGPHWNPVKDFVSDEIASRALFWTDERITGHTVAHVIFSYHENDKRIVTHAKQKMTEILGAAGGEDIWTADRTAHLLGTCRMGNDPKNSVVNADCRSHDLPNLYICDGSIFTTSTGVNPSLTIEAIAARTADQICNGARPRG